MKHTSFSDTQSTTPLKALLLCILLTALTFSPFTLGAVSNNLVQKTVKITTFNAISASTGIKVNYTQGSFNGIATIVVSKEREKDLRVEVKNGCLNLYYDTKSFNRTINNENTVVTVQSPNLNKVNLSSAAQLIVTEPFSTKSDLDMQLSSAGQATFTSLTCNELDADLSSAASLKVNTLKGNLDLDCSSAASASFSTVASGDMELDSSSAASIKIEHFLGGALKAGASSGSKITVNGINSSGNVKVNASSGAAIRVQGKCAGSFSSTSSSGGRVSKDGFSSGKYAQGKAAPSNPEDMESFREQLKATKASLAEQRLALEQQRKQLELQRLQLEEQRQQLEEQRRQLSLQKQELQKQKQAKTQKKTSKKNKDNGSSDSAYITRTDENLRIP